MSSASATAASAGGSPTKEDTLSVPTFIRIESIQSSIKQIGGGDSRPRHLESEDGLEPRRVLVHGKQANQMLLLEFPASESSEDDMMEPPEQAWLQVPSKLENRQVVDLCPSVGSSTRSVVLLDGNILLVFDLAKRAVVFKAKYADATDNISKLHFIC